MRETKGNVRMGGFVKELQNNRSGHRPSQVTIFVVEDEPMVRSLLKRLLQGHNYQVIEADSDHAALEQWAKHHNTISLVIMDFVLPGGMSGFRLIEKFRQQRPGVKVLYTSGYSGDVIPTNTNGKVEGFIQKPFEVPELLQTIQRLLDSK